MNIDNGNGTNGNGKSSHNGNGTNKNNTSVHGNAHLSIPSLVSIQQLEQLSTPASEIQPLPPNTAPRYIPKFDQPVILKQPRKWSRAILWSLMAVTTGTIIWANLALIEEAVSATGKLEASGTTLDVQAPVGRVVKEIYVEDGKQIKAGDKLLTLDNTTSIAQLESLQKIRASLVQENQFYQSQLKNATAVDVTKLKIPTEILDLTISRATLIAENQVYRTQLDGSSSASKLTLEQRERILSNQAELDTRVAAATSQIDQLKRQFQQTDIKLVSTKDTLKMNQGILDNITPLMKDGGISKIQYFKQQE